MGKSSSKLTAQSYEWEQQLNHILNDDELLKPYLTNIFYQEVELSDCMQTLFRGNCLASKIMSHCFRTFGSNYLKQLLQPHIGQLTDPNNKALNDIDQNTKKASSFEIDSAKLDQSGDINVNQKNLLDLTRLILDSILNSALEFPPKLNLLCICLRQVINEKYPNSGLDLRAVGTVIFLRFINPAIVSPFEAGIVDIQLPPSNLRGLKLVSKILQNIANNVEFSKEEHMLPFNDFVRAQFEPMSRWVSTISSDRKLDCHK